MKLLIVCMKLPIVIEALEGEHGQFGVFIAELARFVLAHGNPRNYIVCHLHKVAERILLSVLLLLLDCQNLPVQIDGFVGVLQASLFNQVHCHLDRVVHCWHYL